MWKMHRISSSYHSGSTARQKKRGLITILAIAILTTFALFNSSDEKLSTLSNDIIESGIKCSKNYDPTVTEVNPTMENIFKYFFWTNTTSCKFAVDFGFSLEGNEKMTMAPDGFKAICMDPGIGPTYDDCLVYSFGIRDEWSFDEKMEQYGCDVYAFDPSMDKGDHQHSEHIWFYQIGLGGEDIDKHPATSWKMRTLTSIYEKLKPFHGTRNIDVLKIDIEFSEWETLPQIYDSGILEKVKILTMDVHMRRKATYETFKQYFKIIRSLEKDHGFIRYSSRPSPWANVFIDAWGRRGNFAFEMAWYNSRFINSSFSDPYILI